MYSNQIISTVALFVLCYIGAGAQSGRPDFTGRNYGSFDSSAINAFADTFSKKDLEIYLVDLHNLKERRIFADTITGGVHIIEPLYKQKFISGNLGSVNSASYPALFVSDGNLGMRTGHDQYDLLTDAMKSTDFIDVNRSLWAIHYQKGYMINSSNVAVDFYRRFNNNLLLNFNYDRYSDRSWLGNQENKVGNLDIKFFQGSPDSKRKSYVFYSNKSVDETHSRTLFQGESAASVFSDKWLELGNEILLNSSTDSSKHILTSRLSYKSQNYQFDDTNVSDVESGLYALSEDVSIAKFANRLDQLYLLNSYEIHRERSRLGFTASLFSNQFYNSADSLSQFQAIAGLHYHVEVTDSLMIGGEAHFAYRPDNAESRILAFFNAKGQIINTAVKAGIMQQQPSLFESRALNNRDLLWDNDFSSTLTYSIESELDIHPLKLQFIGHINHVSRGIVPDQNGLPVQLSSAYNHIAIGLSRSINWWRLKSNHNFLYQHLTTEAIARPEWQINGHAEMAFKIFKKRLSSYIGMDYIYYANFTAPSFNPMFGTFYNDNSGTPSGHILLINPYASFKVDDFHFYFKMENALSRIVGQNYFMTRDYNLYDLRISFGIQWRLLD